MSNIRIVRTAMFAFLLSTILSAAANAAKTDIVVLINGDSVTGEVKGLEFGVLRYSTDSMGTVEIDWEDVVSLTTKQSLQVEIATGTRYFGSLHQPDAPGQISIGRNEENVQELAQSDVVRMIPIDIEENFFERVDGSVSFGLDADKGSEVIKTNLSADFRYRTRQYLVGFELDLSATDQPGAETTERRSIGTNYQRFLEKRWYTDWFTSAEKNDQLGVNGRLLAGAGIGRHVIQNNNNQLSLLFGAQAVHENFTGDTPSTTDGEFKFEMTFLHRVAQPDTDFLFSAEIYPLVDDLRSFRGESDLTFRKEFIDDLFFDLSFYYSYITEVPDGGEKDDYGVVWSIGYSF